MKKYFTTKQLHDLNVVAEEGAELREYFNRFTKEYDLQESKFIYVMRNTGVLFNTNPTATFIKAGKPAPKKRKDSTLDGSNNGWLSSKKMCIKAKLVIQENDPIMVDYDKNYAKNLLKHIKLIKK